MKNNLSYGQEHFTRAELRKELIEIIRERDINSEIMAESLGLLPVGFEVLIKKEKWSWKNIFDVAEVLELEVRTELIPNDPWMIKPLDKEMMENLKKDIKENNLVDWK